ncbi:MAG: methylated-DNA--[protein]-cysteine S-methyltransferase [Halanaerobiales bacterium]
MDYSYFMYPSPLGLLEVVFNKRGIRRISFCNKDKNIKDKNINKDKNTCINGDMRINDADFLIYKYIFYELNKYFTGRLKEFEVPVILEGTEFQKRVWKELLKIPYGEYISYGEVARAIGSPNAARAVGNANNKNRLPIIIPCHRVVGTNGKLTGYAGGLERKKWLINHEKKYS